MRRDDSLSRPPARPARTARISASIENAVSAGVSAAAAPRRPLELGVVEPLADPLARDDGQRHLRQLPVPQFLDEDVDLAAAGEADAEGHVVRDPVGDEPRPGAREHLLRGEDDVALDAAARDRAGELALLADRKLRAHGPRRGAASRDYGRESDPLAVL